MSLPVVVIDSRKQALHYWATVTWDNAFSEPGRIAFSVTDNVPWSRMAHALSMKVAYHTGKGLTTDNLNYLCKYRQTIE